MLQDSAGILFFTSKSVGLDDGLSPANVIPRWYDMSRFFQIFCFCLLLLGLLCASAPGEETTWYAPADSYGSQAVLHACWTPEELAGNPGEDKQIRYLRKPDLTPPQRLSPMTSLPPLPESLQGSIRSVAPENGRKVIALTFDVCERSKEITGYDGNIVNYLRAQAVPATFYVGGKWLRSHQEKAMQLMADPLFELGNHAWTHGNLRVLSGERMREQILWTQSQYELLREKLVLLAQQKGISNNEIALIPAIPLTFRFPYGTCSPDALQALAGFGLPAIQWSIVTGDPSGAVSAGAIAATILQRVRPGAIIICHANGRGKHTAAALPLFIPQLRARGYAFVTISHLLKLGTAVRAETCYENRPGDNTRYDALFGEGT